MIKKLADKKYICKDKSPNWLPVSANNRGYFKTKMFINKNGYEGVCMFITPLGLIMIMEMFGIDSRNYDI